MRRTADSAVGDSLQLLLLVLVVSAEATVRLICLRILVGICTAHEARPEAYRYSNHKAQHWSLALIAMCIFSNGSWELLAF